MLVPQCKHGVLIPVDHENVLEDLLHNMGLKQLSVFTKHLWCVQLLGWVGQEPVTETGEREKPSHRFFSFLNKWDVVIRAKEAYQMGDISQKTILTGLQWCSTSVLKKEVSNLCGRKKHRLWRIYGWKNVRWQATTITADVKFLGDQTKDKA